MPHERLDIRRWHVRFESLHQGVTSRSPSFQPVHRWPNRPNWWQPRHRQPRCQTVQRSSHINCEVRQIQHKLVYLLIIFHLSWFTHILFLKLILYKQEFLLKNKFQQFMLSTFKMFKMNQSPRNSRLNWRKRCKIRAIRWTGCHRCKLRATRREGCHRCKLRAIRWTGCHRCRQEGCHMKQGQAIRMKTTQLWRNT